MHDINDLIFLVFNSRKLQLSSVVRILFFCPGSSSPSAPVARSIAMYRDPLSGPTELAFDTVCWESYSPPTMQIWVRVPVSNMPNIVIFAFS